MVVSIVSTFTRSKREHTAKHSNVSIVLLLGMNTHFFDEAELAALAWADAVTQLPDSHAPDDVYENLRRHFSDQEVVDLTLIISLMNAWNRLAVSFRHLPDVRR